MRIDKLVVELGLAPTREKARALILAGQVLVDDDPVTKAGAVIRPDAAVRVRETALYVSRGGEKLAGALVDLGLEVKGKVVLDVGASTGGFTDVCLQQGARLVFAVDVGTNQLAWKLRSDSRVLCLEKTNARYLTPGDLPEAADLALIDVSFISLTKILFPVLNCLLQTAEILALVKPQFEVGKGKVGKGGVVRDDKLRLETVENVIHFARTIGLVLCGRAESRLAGPKGNREIFVHLAPASER